MPDSMMIHSRPIRTAGGRTEMGRVVSLLRVVWRVYLTRKALRELTARERADIGISLPTAVAEAARLPWDIDPGFRRQDGGVMGVAQRALTRVRVRYLMARLGRMIWINHAL